MSAKTFLGTIRRTPGGSSLQALAEQVNAARVATAAASDAIARVEISGRDYQGRPEALVADQAARTQMLQSLRRIHADLCDATDSIVAAS